VELDKRVLRKFLRISEETLIDLEVEGRSTVLIHDTQVIPLTQDLILVDFYQPNLKEEVRPKFLWN
jgi:ribosomal protein L25 (general stress protein Ctc)